MYLRDTVTVSESRKRLAGRGDANVRRWLSTVALANLWVSVVTVRELEEGILLIQRKDPVQALVLRLWADQVLFDFAGRILAIDVQIAQRCAALHVSQTQPENDAYTAATALVHGLTVVTRNVRDFAASRVPVLNPWEPQS